MEPLVGAGVSKDRQESSPSPPEQNLDPSAPRIVAGDARPAETRALLINGGGSAASNYLSHLHHLQDMVAALRARDIPQNRIDVFSGDGDGTGRDLVSRGSEPEDFWLIAGTSAGRALNPSDLTNTIWDGVILRPARLGGLRSWFASMSDTLLPGDTLLIFVTDHGTRNMDDPENGIISLWNESLSVLEFRALLGYLPSGVRVVNVMSQCFSGAFAEAMTPLSSHLPDGNVCGFYSTTGDRMAYGCYPEGRDRDRVGHAFVFIDAMGRHAAMEDVHTAVLIGDTSPDVPVRTSDLFLERMLKDESIRKNINMDDLADAQLALAWKHRARWEPEIRLLDRIGEVYGTFSPRILAELKPKIDSLRSLSGDLDTYEDRWRLALDDLRRDNLNRLLDANPAWKERLEESKLGALDAPARLNALTELLAALKEFTTRRAEVWSRLRDLRETEEVAKSARYRTDIRLAALMRMRAVLLRVAGIQLLNDTAAGAVDAPANPARTRDAERGDRPGVDQAGAGGVASKGNAPVDQAGAGGVASSGNAPVDQAGAGGVASKGNAPVDQVRARNALRALAALEACEGSRIGSFDSSRETPALQEATEPLPGFEADLAAVRQALPSWLGIRFRAVTDKQRERLEVARGAAMIDQVYPETPASAASLEMGDIVLGPAGRHFTEPNQIREWIMTSPRGTPLSLDVQREGKTLPVKVSLVPFPAKLPALPEPPGPGSQAPRLGSLRMVRPEPGEGADLTNRRHLLFFWATWCGPCKSSVPELMAFARRSGVPVVAVSDEDEETIRKFLTTWTAPFPGMVASDDLRRTTMSYGISGTPTFVLVDEHGRIEWRQVGYSPKAHLSIPGWTWSGASE